jgi:hypothetical protein
MDIKNLTTARVTALMSTYPLLFKVRALDVSDKIVISDSLYVVREELIVVDGVLSQICGTEYQKFVNLLKARKSNVLIIIDNILEVSRSFSPLGDDAEPVSLYRDLDSAYKSLVVKIGAETSFVFSWGESRLNDCSPPLGQFVLRDLKKQHMDVVFIPDI